MSSVRRSTRIANASKHSIENESVPAVETKKQKTLKKVTDAGKSEEKILEVGEPIPDITLKNENDEEVSLKKVAFENRIVAIFAYPKASTPGCTRQACGFSANFASLTKKAKIYGLSSDLPKAQKNFITKQSLKLDGLLSDPEKKLIGVLGAKKSPSGIKRSHWIFVDGKLKVSRVQISPEVSVQDGKKEIEEIYASFGSNGNINDEDGVQGESGAMVGDVKGEDVKEEDVKEEDVKEEDLKKSFEKKTDDTVEKDIDNESKTE